jgi:hypothetical protein
MGPALRSPATQMQHRWYPTEHHDLTAGGRRTAAGAAAVPWRLLRPDAAAAQLLAAWRVPAGVPAPDRLRRHRYSTALGTSYSLGGATCSRTLVLQMLQEGAGVTCLQLNCVRLGTPVAVGLMQIAHLQTTAKISPVQTVCLNRGSMRRRAHLHCDPAAGERRGGGHRLAAALRGGLPRAPHGAAALRLQVRQSS